MLKQINLHLFICMSDDSHVKIPFNRKTFDIVFHGSVILCPNLIVPPLKNLLYSLGVSLNSKIAAVSRAFRSKAFFPVVLIYGLFIFRRISYILYVLFYFGPISPIYLRSSYRVTEVIRVLNKQLLDACHKVDGDNYLRADRILKRRLHTSAGCVPDGARS